MAPYTFFKNISNYVHKLFGQGNVFNLYFNQRLNSVNPTAAMAQAGSHRHRKEKEGAHVDGFSAEILRYRW